MGSVSIGSASSLPARLHHSGDIALVRGLAQAQPAEAELAVVGARPPAPAAAVIAPRLVLGLAGLLDDLRCLGHISLQIRFCQLPAASSSFFLVSFVGFAFCLFLTLPALVGLRVLGLELLERGLLGLGALAGGLLAPLLLG